MSWLRLLFTSLKCLMETNEFVNRLRTSGNYIPELALVAEENTKLIGHIAD